MLVRRYVHGRTAHWAANVYTRDVVAIVSIEEGVM